MSEFMGNPVRVMLSKQTQEVSFVADDVAVCLGYRNLEDMMSDDEILDGYSALVKFSPKDALQPIDLPDFCERRPDMSRKIFVNKKSEVTFWKDFYEQQQKCPHLSHKG